MAVNLKTPQSLMPIKGIKLASIEANIRYQNRDDLLLLTLCEGSSVAAVFTQNKYCAAPVLVAREHLAASDIRALLINSGNANAGTGQLGLDNTRLSCQAVASALGLNSTQVLPFSTGVIGEQLAMDKLVSGVNSAAQALGDSDWLKAAETIMTTDTIAKGVSEQVDINGTLVTITGIAKGSGMVCPNMATLLSYVATDVVIPQELLQDFLNKGVEKSFNRITVDSDTSTNDALVLMATGTSGVVIESYEDDQAIVFNACLQDVLIKLATAIVRDAEGATKFVNVVVSGGDTLEDCSAVAYSVAHSPLVKTALFASDPNWGRILMAIGKSDVEQLDVTKIDITINEQPLIESGQPASSYSEEVGQKVFQEAEIVIEVDLNQGGYSHNVWTSDLSHEYVSINADYRS